jgi:transcriptional regulator with XRE-family HTH domain
MNQSLLVLNFHDSGKRPMRYTMADRLKARCRQLGLNAAQVGEIASVNRTFVYDIKRGKSANPNLAKLDRVAQALKVERNWLLHGMGEVQGEAPILTTVLSPSHRWRSGPLWAAAIWSNRSPWTDARIISSDRG